MRNTLKFHLSDGREKLEAMLHCRCEGGAVHAHCRDCNAPIEEGGWVCEACRDRNQRCRKCRICWTDFYLPPDGQKVPWYYKFGLCSEKCFEPYVPEALKYAGVPPRYQDCTLDNFDPYTPSLKKKLEFITDWSKGDLEIGLCLSGNVGTGKSHLLVGVMRRLFRRCRSGNYINARGFALRCQASFSENETVQNLVDELLEKGFLVIDDLGTEKPTEFVRQCLLHLVDEAYTREKLLIVATNLSLEQLHEMEPRQVSRLVEICQVMKFDEDDYRVWLSQRRDSTTLASRKEELPDGC